MVATRCGPTEVHQAGGGPTLLMVHGSGGNHDQGMGWAPQLALRHPGRVSTLVLVVPIAWKPGGVADTAPPVSDAKNDWRLRRLGSDVLCRAGLQVAHDSVFRHVLATPPELIHAASALEQARVGAMAERVLPVDRVRAAGSR